jgi:hypothetical protein
MWTMDNVPVISTDHLPNGYDVHLDDIDAVFVDQMAFYSDGVFVKFSSLDLSETDTPMRYIKIIEWVKNHYKNVPDHEKSLWVRFDNDADTVDELKIFR